MTQHATPGPDAQEVEAVAKEMRAYADANIDNVIELRRTGSSVGIPPDIRQIHLWAERLGERGKTA